MLCACRLTPCCTWDRFTLRRMSPNTQCSSVRPATAFHSSFCHIREPVPSIAELFTDCLLKPRRIRTIAESLQNDEQIAGICYEAATLSTVESKSCLSRDTSPLSRSRSLTRSHKGYIKIGQRGARKAPILNETWGRKKRRSNFWSSKSDAHKSL